MSTTELYAAIVALGIEHHSNEADLYLPATQQTKNIIEHHNCGYSVSEQDGEVFFLVPFGYAPWFDATQTLPRNELSYIRALFDKAADAHDGDYPKKVDAGLLAVYLHGRHKERVAQSRRQQD